ncbi:MAG: helix-turn-helix transcriptional regulator [Burkholderiales bacterium]|nr:helix-turn-helix transcriptional regulator [Burkholderiales bacterium]
MKNKLHNNCPVGRVASLLSDTWTMLIIRDLLKKEMRFSDLERSLEGISTRTLIKKIKCLESEGIVEKEDMHYVITKRGKKLKKIIDAMSEYGKTLPALK